MAVRAVLCDLGGVVLRIDADRIRSGWACLSALSVAEVYAAYPDEVYERFERDEVTADHYFHHVRSRLRLEGTDDEIRAAFNDLFLGVDHETLEVLQGLRQRGVLILALTNTNRTHHKVWSRRFADALAVFDEVHTSHDLGYRKPEPEAFRRVLDKHDLAPEDVLFVDDVPDLVAGAEAVGLNGVVFTDAPTLAQQLEAFDWQRADRC